MEIEIERTIDKSVLQKAPFDHVYLQDVFSERQYLDILSNLPESNIYREFKHPDALRPDGSSTRLRVFLYPEMLGFLPPRSRQTWRAVSKALRSTRVQAAFKRKFRAALEARFGRKVETLSFHANLILVRDLPGYRIAIHADTYTKAITVQFYLPRDAAQAHLGTVFHYGETGDAAAQTKALQFVPACGYAFPVQPSESWHSVPTTRDEDGERNSLMLTYYVKGGPIGALKRLRQRANEFGAKLLGR